MMRLNPLSSMIKKVLWYLKSIFLIYEQSLDFLNAYCLRPLWKHARKPPVIWRLSYIYKPAIYISWRCDTTQFSKNNVFVIYNGLSWVSGKWTSTYLHCMKSPFPFLWNTLIQCHSHIVTGTADMQKDAWQSKQQIADTIEWK